MDLGVKFTAYVMRYSGNFRRTVNKLGMFTLKGPYLLHMYCMDLLSGQVLYIV